MGKPWLVHIMARCTDCGKEWDNYRTAKKEARNHYRKTGHEIVIETGYANIWERKVRIDGQKGQ